MEDVIKADPFSFPCLSGPSEQGAEDPAEAFEKLRLSDARLLAGSAPTAVLLPDGSLAVSMPLSARQISAGCMDVWPLLGPQKAGNEKVSQIYAGTPSGNGFVG